MIRLYPLKLALLFAGIFSCKARYRFDFILQYEDEVTEIIAYIHECKSQKRLSIIREYMIEPFIHSMEYREKKMHAMAIRKVLHAFYKKKYDLKLGRSEKIISHIKLVIAG